MRHLRVVILLFFLSLTVDATYADSMKCGTRLVSPGDSKVKVLLRCGDPFFREIVGERTIRSRYLGVFSRSQTVLIEKWTYNLGSTRFLRTLTFEGDKLVNIEKGDKP
jgi:hypothetical protein